MTQAMVNLIKNSKSTQTGENEKEFVFYLTDTKSCRVYYSSAYKDYVLSFNFGSTKNLIFTRLMWNKFVKYIPDIEKTFNTISD